MTIAKVEIMTNWRMLPDPRPAQAHHRGDVQCSAVLVAECDPLAFVADVHRNPYLTCRRPELYAGIAALPLPPPATGAARLVEFVVGNSAEKVDGLFHWTAYLRPIDPVSCRYLVSSVAFELHPYVARLF